MGLDLGGPAGPVSALAVSIPLALACANAVNIVDGQDGLAGGLAALASLSMGVSAHILGVTPGLSLGLAVGGSLLVFLLWNAPPASLFLGNGGAYGVGIVLAAQASGLVTRDHRADRGGGRVGLLRLRAGRSRWFGGPVSRVGLDRRPWTLLRRARRAAGEAGPGRRPRSSRSAISGGASGSWTLAAAVPPPGAAAVAAHPLLDRGRSRVDLPFRPHLHGTPAGNQSVHPRQRRRPMNAMPEC